MTFNYSKNRSKFVPIRAKSVWDKNEELKTTKQPLAFDELKEKCPTLQDNEITEIVKFIL